MALFKPYIGTCYLCGAEDVPIVVRAGHCQRCRDEINKEKKKERKRVKEDVQHGLDQIFKNKNKNANADSRFYKRILDKWETDGELYCKECGIPIEEPSASNVAHILSRGAFPQLRHDPENVICLCFDCHFQLDHGDPTTMELYDYLQRLKEDLKRKAYGIEPDDTK